MKSFWNFFVVFSAICSILSLVFDISAKTFGIVTIWNIIFLIYFCVWINNRIDSQKGNSNV